MRRTQPPRLKLRSARKDKRQRAVWVIKDQQCEISTGCGEGEREEAERKLASYILHKRQPDFGNGDPTQVVIGDCLAVYGEKHGPTTARADGLLLDVERLLDFWGSKYVNEISPETCNAYVAWRCDQGDRRATINKGRTVKVSTAKRELVTLSAALNWCYTSLHGP
jgi:hypothetical protein